MKIPRCDIATHGLKGALRSQGGCRFSPPPRYNSNCRSGSRHGHGGPASVHSDI